MAKRLLSGTCVCIVWAAFYQIAMSRSSFAEHAASLSAELTQSLRRHVVHLAGTIGHRSVYRHRALIEAEQYLIQEWETAGLQVKRQEYTVEPARLSVANIEVEIHGTTLPHEIVVVGAHYDSVAPDCPGANDNGSGTAALLELAKAWKDRSPARTLRFVAFVNEEPPYFTTQEMGSMVYANAAKKRGENIVGMVSLETIGYFTDAPKSQKYPPGLSLFYPSTGNFIAFVGNLGSASLVRKAAKAFRSHSELPMEMAILPSFTPGVGWSDQYSFWENGFDAMMVTDTAPFRYPHYHLPTDTADKLDYGRFSMVVAGFSAAIDALVN